MNIIGYSLIAFGLLFMCIGTLGTYRFKSFYSRILAASKVDLVGELTILIGLIVLNGFNAYSMKLIFMMMILIIINPLVSHMIVRSAVISGYKVRKE
jgi:multicomponent Na+:H+ antiporter subunit G